MKKPLIIAFDGVKNPQFLLETIQSALADPVDMVDFVSHFKFNDTLHLRGFKSILPKIIKLYPGVSIFWDLKLPDTNGTDKNILSHYLVFMRPGDIVTVSSSCSVKAFRDIRAFLPIGVKIAIVSVLTDTDILECRYRRGMIPSMSILNDALNLIAFEQYLFDAVICSPAELKFLKMNLPDNIDFFVPGVRDSWMEAGQQSKDRINGIVQVLNDGASGAVLGAQLLRGNPDKQINAAQSRLMTIELTSEVISLLLVPGDPLATLVNFQGYYRCPEDEQGRFKGPLVAYAGTYPSPTGEKNFAGNTYFNFAVIEQHPRVLEYFAKLMVTRIRSFQKDYMIKVDCLVGVPSGGVKIAQAVARLLDIPGICLEREVTALKTATEKEKFNLVFRRNDGVIKRGDHILLFEDLCNNFKTTQKAVDVIAAAGGDLIGVACIANRSDEKVWEKVPVLAGIEVPSPQYKQEDPVVADLIAEGKLSTDPKKDWAMLKASMIE
jgi:orotate phosphoribosyltransferase